MDSDRRDELENNLLAAGGVYMALGSVANGGLDPKVVTREDEARPGEEVATNQIDITLPYMKSRYRITVERVPDSEDGES